MSDSDLYGDSVYEGGDAVDDTEDLDPIESLSGDDPDENDETSYVPPDREPYNLRHVPTAFEEERGESLDQKLSEEEPDVSVDDIDAADEQPRAGRLVAPDEGGLFDEEKDEIAEDVGPAGYASSAEEAAMHVIPEPGEE